MHNIRLQIEESGGTSAILNLFRNNVPIDTKTAFDIETKSKSIREKLAILKLCPYKQEIENVGKKFSDYVFYIRCTDEEVKEVFNWQEGN